MVAWTRVLATKVEKNGLSRVVLSGFANGEKDDRKRNQVSLVLSYKQSVKSTMVNTFSPPCSLVPMKIKHLIHLMSKCIP